MSRAHAILLCFFCFLIKPGLAKDIVFSHYKLGRGLPANIIIQDNKGYLWIASDGLIKFDGVAIKQFIADPKQLNAIANNGIRSISEAPDGTLWMGTMYGISHYCPDSDKFQNYSHHGVSGADNNVDNTVFVDNAGKIWCGNRYGLSRFDEQRKTFYQYNLAKYQHAKEPGGSFIVCIIQDKSDAGWLWLGTYNGLVHFRKKDGYAVYYYFSKHFCIINKLLMDRHNRLWICTWGDGLGLFIPTTKQVLFRSFGRDDHNGTTNIVHDICEQPVDNNRSLFYLCTEKGLIVFEMNHETKAFQNTPFNNCYTHLASLPESIGGKPQAIMTDRQGIIWIGTDKDLSYILPANQVFSHHFLQLGIVNGVTEGHNDANQPVYWISSWYNRGLVYLDSAFRQMTFPHYFDKLQHSADSRQINSIIEIRQQLWVATMDGLFLYNKATRKAAVFLKNSGLPDNRICGLCYDHKNKLLWVGTYSKGLFLFNPETQKRVALPVPVSMLSSGRINSLYEDNKGGLWLGDDELLYRFNESDFSYKVYKHKAENLRSKAGGNITSITEDAQQRVWIASQQGLNLYDNAKDDFWLFTTSDGLSNNNINSITADRNGNLWLATAKGLDRMNLNDFRVKSYYNENGLSDDANLNCLLTSKTGTIIIGGNDMLNVFRPGRLIKNNWPPKVYINTLKLNNTQQLFIINSNKEKISLKYNQNYFTIDFVALNFMNAADNRYAYQLQGVDKDFIQVGNARSATYANIEPGSYVFTVKAANNDGLWSNYGVSIILVIAPPFWKTWWFMALCIFVVLLTAYALYNYRVAQLLKLERLRTKISTDLHDEIGSTLSAISILSSMAVRRKDKPYTEKMLEEIKESAADLMQKMDDIVWSINPKNDSLESFLWRTKDFAIRLFDARHIGYEIDIPEDISAVRLPMEKRQNLYLIIKESINNIVKHADCTFVRFSIRDSNHHLCLLIEDNGKGFDTEQLSYGNGLLSLQNRAKFIHAELSVRSAPGKGTTVALKLKII